LVDDTNIKCLSAQHLRWSLGIGVPSLFLGLVVPIALLAYAAKSKKLQASEDFKLRYSFMFKIYKDGFFGWELVIMSRKVLIIIISVFISSTYLQVIILKKKTSPNLLGLFVYNYPVGSIPNGVQSESIFRQKPQHLRRAESVCFDLYHV